ncbi:MAG: zinc-ribbon domain-containing protein [Gammaproteobacteria bacterium]|nr:zinc-ribbon domain-containing protein [Gammaproteobacteria bacterium]
MYTQCPDCDTAFKVTAEVLKQAAGKVRCGGCGNAFNALAYLSEDMPAQAAPVTHEPALPELTPEPPEHGETLPRSISAEQSAALLKTLDELAGSDIKIEDTGVEWRVLDEDEAAEPAADDDNANIVDGSDDVVGASALDELDEFLDESPTPVDEFLTKTPEVVDSPEIFDESANQFGSTSVDEIRFDDNTPLPDDFDLDRESSYVAPPVASSEQVQDNTPEPMREEPLPEITLSDPEEWNDILGEFQDLAEEVASPAVESEEISSPVVEPEKSDVPDDEPELEKQPEPIADDNSDEPLDVDTQFALQAEAMGIDLSGMHELEELEFDKDGPDYTDSATEELIEAVEDDEELEKLDEIDELQIDELQEASVPEAASESEDIGDDIDEAVDDLEVVAGETTQFDFAAEQEEPDSASPSIEDELAALEINDPRDEAATDSQDEHFVAPLSEAEQTVNRLIDQELMALAVEDEDGFASTMVIPEERAEDAAGENSHTPADEPGGNAVSDAFTENEDDSGFESIIMEGEIVRSALDNEKIAADKAAAAELNEIAKAAEAAVAVESGGNRTRLVAGISVLAVLLVAQVIHQSREALATIPAFNQTVGPIYRAIGQPLQPAWDVAGWRFEVSQGNTDADDGADELTIYSRLGNQSDKPLPYPLIAISLTDRFEETIGSHVLDPAEYLPENVDPRKHVRPGNTFNAVMSINSPAENVTGFKLNVCYRLEGERLSCAIDDFK